MKNASWTLAIAMLVLGALPAWASDNNAVSIPAGSALVIQLRETLSSKANQDGDRWTGEVMQPIIANHETVVPIGSVVEGHVSFVKPAGRVKAKAEMRLTPDTIATPEGIQYQISAGLQDAEGAEGVKMTGQEGTMQGPGKSKKDTAKDAGIDAGVGAGVGAIADGGTGALYGAGIGAVAGMIHSLYKKHKDLVLPAGTELTFVLSRATAGKKSAASPVSANP